MLYINSLDADLHAWQTLVMKHELTASRVFAAMSVFEVLQSKLQMVFGLVPTLVRGEST